MGKLSKNKAQSSNPGIQAATLADNLNNLSPKELGDYLFNLSPQDRADVFSYLDLNTQISVALLLKRRDLAKLLSCMSSDDRANFYKSLPEDLGEEVLPALAQAEREDIRRLISYKEGTAGSVMTSEYATLSCDLTVEEALIKLRREAPDKETIYCAYVVTSGRHLIGLVSLKDLITSRSTRRIEEIMKDEFVFSSVDEDREDAARKIQKYDLLALPVVDSLGVLVGIITHDDALDIVTQEHTEDLERFMAIRHERGTYLGTTAGEHFRKRIGWLVSLAIFGLASGYIIHTFESTLIAIVLLTFYIPMITDSGGNTGSQAATMVIRALALREIDSSHYLKVLLTEFKVGLRLALILGSLALLKVYFLASLSNQVLPVPILQIAVVVSIALGIQVITATLIGASLPLLAHRLKVDPAVIASPALTTVVDITGLFIYINTAKLLLSV
jgi:magnesium transporter